MSHKGKFTKPKPSAPMHPAQKMAKNTFNTPKARPSPAKGGSPINPKVPNSKVGKY